MHVEASLHVKCVPHLNTYVSAALITYKHTHTHTLMACQVLVTRIPWKSAQSKLLLNDDGWNSSGVHVTGVQTDDSHALLKALNWLFTQVLLIEFVQFWQLSDAVWKGCCRFINNWAPFILHMHCFCHFVADMAGQRAGGGGGGGGGDLSENFQIWEADGDPLLTFSLSNYLCPCTSVFTWVSPSLGRWTQENFRTLLICCSTWLQRYKRGIIHNLICLEYTRLQDVSLVLCFCCQCFCL